VKKFGKISRQTWTMISAVLVLIGVVMYAYPIIANFISQQYTDVTIKSFDETVQTMQVQKVTSGITLNAEGSPLDELLEKVEAYNKNLYDEGQKDLVDPFSYQVSSFDLSNYGIEDNLFGYIEIPKLSVKLGVYLGATSANMSKGAVHLTQTSLPIGGVNTNAVIAAHRGTRYRDMFLHIDNLKSGDTVKITNAWKTLTYKVTSTAIIAPNQIDKVLIQKGRDMVTLISCNPYGKSTQRYVVYCDRVTDD
jgi:LPXTG-site transpeptidase (sortase) family protein